MSERNEKEIDPSSSLCLECGLCCNGSIFSHAELNEDDCKRLGISYHNDARLSFPCQHLSGRSCTVYQQRPAICASYQCKTLAAMKAREIGLGEAQDIIRKASKLDREFEQSIPPGITRKQAIICVAKEQCP